MANFIVQFPLRTEKYQEDILNKRFEIGRKMYNSLVKVIQKRYKEIFDNFYRLHNLEVDRLKGYKNLSSIAI